MPKQITITLWWIIGSILFGAQLFFGIGLAADIPLEKMLVSSHKKHIEKGYKCQVCHVKITESENASDRNLPSEATCRVCHDGIIIRDDCSVCHLIMTDIQALPNPEREIIFSHRMHVNSEPDCYFCHEGIHDTHYCKGEYLPEMSVCMNCHNGDQAMNECHICHGNKPLSRLKPEDHNITWIHGHRSAGRDHRGKCEMCHTESMLSCQECHRGFNELATSHPQDYLLEHALDARINASDCASCHDPISFCQDCHNAEGVDKPVDHLVDPFWNTTGHAMVAKRDMETCVVCHNGPGSNCTTCHREGMTNPHPEDYGQRLGKGPWHEDSDYMCYDCHIEQTDPAMGFCGYCHF